MVCERSERPQRSRFILGGAYGEPVYMAHDPDAQSPFGRLAAYGFRLVKYTSPPPASFLAPIDYPSRDFADERPVAAAEFDLMRRFYAYDRTPLDAKVESVDDTNPSWRLEKITFKTAYDANRMAAYLFLPRSAEPPYQAVVHFPPSTALRERSFEARLKMELSPQSRAGISFLVQSGRAVLFPIYKSTFERGDGLLSDRPTVTNSYRDHVVQWTKDVSRSMDYLETRGDIAKGVLAITAIAGVRRWARLCRPWSRASKRWCWSLAGSGSNGRRRRSSSSILRRA